MKKLFFWVMAVVLAVGLVLPGVTATKVSAASDLTISTPMYFSELDGNPLYDADGTVDKILTVDGNLLLNGTGSIHANDDRYKPTDPLLEPNDAAFPITIVVSGNMEMQAGTSILAENQRQSGKGGDIAITVGGDLTLRNGALISSSNLTSTSGNGNMKAGDIKITVGNYSVTPPTGIIEVEDGATVKAYSFKGTGGAIVMNAAHTINMDGLVESPSTGTGTGSNQGHGGTITLDAGCMLIISDTGVVSSRGQNPGADLVHLEACDVVIYGKVESTTTAGHGIPHDPPNHLNNSYRPDKPSNSVTGVEIWAGNSLIIDSTNGHNGEVKADIGGAGGASGCGWIDLFALNDITIIGDGGGLFAVHAINGSGSDFSPNKITIKSTEGNVTASGLAVSADATGAGSYGGAITIEAALDVTLDTASIFARGDFVQTGGFGRGGQVKLRSFQGTLSWQNGVGDVTPTGADTIPPINVSAPLVGRGVITLQDCTAGLINRTGTTFPYNGDTPTTPTELADDCNVAAPTLPSYDINGDGIIDYVVLPPCDQCNPVECCQWCNKGAVLSQVRQNMGDNCTVPDIFVDVRLPLNDPILPTELGSGQPATGSIQLAIDYVNSADWLINDPTPGDGEIFIGVNATDCTDNKTAECDCPKSRPYAGDNPYGTENVVITNTRADRLNVFGCSVSLHAADANLPVITIENSAGKVTVLDIHVSGSHVAGYLIQNNHDLVVVKNSRSFGVGAGAGSIGYLINDSDIDNNADGDNVEITGSPEISGHAIGILVEGDDIGLRTNNMIVNNGIGIKITGDNNESNGNDVGKEGRPNGTGILVNGKDNYLHGDNVIYNTGDGIVIVGSGTTLGDRSFGANEGNFVTDEDTQYNGDDGMVVSGNFNWLDRNHQVKFNSGDGVEVSGSNNLLNENSAEENGGSGFVISGNANNLVKNEAIENDGEGIWVTGDNNVLDENTAEDNTLNGIKADSSDGANGNNLEKNEGKNNTWQGIRACGQNDLGGNTGSGNGVNPQVDFICAVAGPAKFFVADDGEDAVYKYDAAGILAGSFDLDNDNGAASGIAVVFGSPIYVYVLDKSDKQVYQYDSAGTLVDTSKVLKEQGGGSLSAPTGLAIDGDAMWVVDASKKKSYRYSLAIVFSDSGDPNAAQEIAFTGDNDSAEGLAIDGTNLYVLDDGDNMFYRYPRAGGAGTASNELKEVGGGDLDSPSGAMLDGTSLWVVDKDNKKVYEYSLSSLSFGDSDDVNALFEFNLDPANGDAQGL